MERISEKLIYGKDLEEKSFSFRYDLYVWAEDLLDKQLYIYNGSFKNVVQRLNIEYDECGLIYIKYDHMISLQCIEAKCSMDGEKVFISEKQFNQYWRLMQHSIVNGIRLRERNNAPDDLPNLDLLKESNKTPVIRNQMITYVQNQKNESEIPKDPEVEKRHRNRQSAMDNPKLIYCYSAHANGNKVYHDKTCEDIKLIKDQHFRATSVPPEGREPCAKCRRTMYIRQACGNHPKQMKYLQVIFQREKIKNQTIKKFLDKGYSFSTTSLDELHVFCNEDNWIARHEDGVWTLWHNNYVRVSETTRFISDGFHDQNFKNPRLIPLLSYIGNYTWEGHLEAEQVKKEAEEKNLLQPTENLDASVSETITQEPVKKKSHIRRIMRWFSEHVHLKMFEKNRKE